MGVEANATSSTTIVVKWGEVPREHQNGQIEGYKVYYGSNLRLPFQVSTISVYQLFYLECCFKRTFFHVKIIVIEYLYVRLQLFSWK